MRLSFPTPTIIGIKLLYIITLLHYYYIIITLLHYYIITLLHYYIIIVCLFILVLYCSTCRNTFFSSCSVVSGAAVLCVCVCFFSSHSFWTSSSLDIPAGVTQEEGHTGFLIHLPSAVRALIFLARRIQPFLSLDPEVEFCVLTILSP